NIHFQPGVNEDLAATAVWGSQQFDLLDQPLVDGVYGMWYGKGPGVDRSGDPMKHGNLFGAHKHGGVLVVYGDDHPGKSSTVAHQSEQALAANSIPSLYPANVAEIIEYGLAGWALSRYSGLWVGLKTVNETVEQTATVNFSDLTMRFAEPAGDGLPDAAHAHAYNPQGDEVMLQRTRLPLARKFIYEARLDQVRLDGGARGLGVVTSGKAFGDVCEALRLLGIESERARQLGISVYKVACIWPLEPRRLREFAAARSELLFVEEKRPFMQGQAAEILYDLDQRPVITGKQDHRGNALLPADVQLQPLDVALVIAARLEANGLTDDEVRERVAQLRDTRKAVPAPAVGGLTRAPFFCSGCPHNTSTRLPEGSVAGAGIGCHGMASFNRSDMLPFSQMGGEGATWLGISPFTGTEHVFQNLGDGTYYHSGLLAVRAAVAAGANITYKILYNDAVAMTGGQPVDGPISVAEIARQALDEGVRRCVVVSDAPEHYQRSHLPAGVDVFHRDTLDSVQRNLRQQPGCTVLIYEQTCATEKRRRRKRGLMPAAPARAVINPEVCEGCGDCSAQSSCLSIQPRETDLGRKRRVDQYTCNQDMSCVKGFCPSFVNVYGGALRKPASQTQVDEVVIPPPEQATLDAVYSVLIAGIGGTGVISVGAVLAMAAHIEGKQASVYDMTGLAQKGGAVYSHLRLAGSETAIGSQRIGAGQADLVLGFDLLAALAGDGLQSIDRQRTRFLANLAVAPTAAFQKDQTLAFDCDEPIARAARLVAADALYSADFTHLAIRHCGDAIACNLMAVGYAFQLGLIPLTVASIEQAIELNGVAIPMNLAAFRIGRQLAHDPDSVSQPDDETSPASPSAEVLVERFAERLDDYQNVRYAARFRALVEPVLAVEEALGTPGTLAATVARQGYRLMAYKDEYEVARLHTSEAFLKEIAEQFDGDYRLRFNLAPPLLSPRDPETGHLQKREFGEWILPAFRLLARFKFLRDTPFDPFGYTQERRQERALIKDYEAVVASLVGDLSEQNYERAVELAALPDRVRGYGHIKENNMQQYRSRQAELLAARHA
ncbi:MAG: indolepyruvate ferredoxin oxidoreductase family protein, partial [Pseudomonadota bacterium]